MLEKLFTFLRLMFWCERGEVGEDITEPEDGSVSTEVDDGEELEDVEEEKQEPEKNPEPKQDDDALKSLKDELEFAKKEINRLGYALRTKDKPAEKEGETKFTDAQILAIVQEHKDDPAVMVQVMKELSRQGTADAVSAAEKAVDIKTKRAQIDDFLTKAYPDTLKEGTEKYNAVSKAVDWFHLDGHPFARELALAGLMMKTLPQTIEQIKEAAKKEVLEQSAESARKKGIKNNQPAGSGGDGGEEKKVVAPSETQRQAAKLLFPNDKKAQEKYFRMVNKAKAA